MRTRPYRLAVIAFDEMDLLDVAAPLEVFSTAGRKWNFRAIKAELVSPNPGLRTTRAQVQLGPAAALASCPQPELLLIPGGYGARRALEDPLLIDYLAGVRDGITLTLSVGLGTLVAARAGLLRNSEVAVAPPLIDDLRSLDASITPRPDAPIVLASRSISVAHNGSALDLGLEVVARLLGKKQADGTALELGYAWGTETVAIEIKS